MATDDKGKQTRRAGSLGAVSLRLVVALGASAGLTAAVALPMAYQAQQAREQDQIARQRQTQPGTEVLGVTTVPTEVPVPHDGIYWVSDDAGAERDALHRAMISGSVLIVLDLPGVTRVDFRLDDGPVTTVTAEPWQFPESEPLDTDLLGAGEHVMLATVGFDDDRNELREARFTVPAG